MYRGPRRASLVVETSIGYAIDMALGVFGVIARSFGLAAALAAGPSGCNCGGAESPILTGASGPRGAGGPPSASTVELGSSQVPSPSAAADSRAGFLKGQLHAHSNASGDSETLPGEVAAWYARRGYDFLVFTDHNRVTDTPDPPGLLTLPGVELTQNLSFCEPPPEPGLACLLHVNALFVERAAASRGALEPGALTRSSLYARAVDAALDMGAIAQLNHPNFHYGADAALVLELSKRGLALLEIANEAVDSANEGDGAHPSTEALWDDVLTRGGRVLATATDDAHHYEDAEEVRARGETAYVGDRGFVMVRAEKTAASIRAAIASGDFYSSTGVLLDRLEVSEAGIAIDVRGGGEGTLIEVIGRGGSIVATSRGPALRFDPMTAAPGYLRVRVRDAQGRRAWSQPLWTVPGAEK